MFTQVEKNWHNDFCENDLISETTHVEFTYGDDFMLIADKDEKTGKLIGTISEIVDHVMLDNCDSETIMSMLREKYLAKKERRFQMSEA